MSSLTSGYVHLISIWDYIRSTTVQSYTGKYHGFVASVLLRVHSTSNNAYSNKRVCMYVCVYVCVYVCHSDLGREINWIRNIKMNYITLSISAASMKCVRAPPFGNTHGNTLETHDIWNCHICIVLIRALKLTRRITTDHNESYPLWHAKQPPSMCSVRNTCIYIWLCWDCGESSPLASAANADKMLNTVLPNVYKQQVLEIGFWQLFSVLS